MINLHLLNDRIQEGFINIRNKVHSLKPHGYRQCPCSYIFNNKKSC